MSTSYEAAERLFNLGEFEEIRRSTDLSDSGIRRLAVAHQLLVAHALALMGESQSAIQIVRLVDTSNCPPLLRSNYHLVLGLTQERSGAWAEALAHFQTALRLSVVATDSLQIAWSHVRILRHLIDRGSTDASQAILREARNAATRAGDVHVTVFLHESVAVWEGQLGRFDEARRHCEIAESLLQRSPNAWLRSSNLVNRGCLAALNGEYDKATRYFLDARADIARSGIRSGAENNLAHCYIVTGQYRKAGETLERIVRSEKTPRIAFLGAMEGLARLRLAQRDFVGCQEALRTIYENAEANPALAHSFHTRWAAVTMGRLLLNKGETNQALNFIRSVENQSGSTTDVPLEAALNITAAHALSSSGNHAEAARRLLEAHRRGVTAMRELQAPYYFSCALTLPDASAPMGAQAFARALTLWKSQRVVSVPFEISSATASAALTDAQRSKESQSTASVVEAIAAAFDLAHTPTLLGAELLNVVDATGCMTNVQIAETTEAPVRGMRISKSHVEIPLSSSREKIVLRGSAPTNTEQAIVVAAISRISAAAIALEDARSDERKRAALWPVDSAETDAGALFLAEEMQTLLSTARRVAPTNVPVLITGETGTGKEVLARAIHAYSNRSKAAFVPFNCTSTPRDMLDSQLFGHRRGSFTGAIENFQGIIRGATSGTLFLDEIGDMNLEVQPKLLRFLESGEVHPVGETQPVRADVRVIAATNANLDALVSDGRFREDLFYRLNIVHLPIPPLRERRIEIPALANHYLEKYAQENAKGRLRLAEETMEYLALYRWPGNVRQLANEMRRVAALCEVGAVVMPEHLSRNLAASRRTIPASERALDTTEVVVRLDQPMAAATEHLERAMLQYALKECGGMEETAARLGLSRKGLYLKRQRLGIEPPESAAVGL